MFFSKRIFKEIWPPRLVDLVDFSAGACDAQQVLQMEAVVLTALKWYCSPVTAVHWLAFYLQLISEQERKSMNQYLRFNSSRLWRLLQSSIFRFRRTRRSSKIRRSVAGRPRSHSR